MTLKIAVIAVSREVKSSGEIRTHDGEEFWVVVDRDYGTHTTIQVKKGVHPPKELAVWNSTVEAAHALAKWEGHPWWVSVKKLIFINVTPHYKQIVEGYYRVH